MMRVRNVFNRYFKFYYDYENKESIILRDFLALERTRLANERTLLAYLRTALYLLLGGVAVLQLRGFVNITWIGYVSLALSGIFAGVGVFRYFRLKHQLHDYYLDEKKKQKDLKTEGHPPKGKKFPIPSGQDT